jgi:glycosyltransferase involved in cell wall biosynthesis
MTDSPLAQRDSLLASPLLTTLYQWVVGTGVRKILYLTSASPTPEVAETLWQASQATQADLHIATYDGAVAAQFRALLSGVTVHEGWRVIPTHYPSDTAWESHYRRWLTPSHAEPLSASLVRLAQERQAATTGSAWGPTLLAQWGTVPDLLVLDGSEFTAWDDFYDLSQSAAIAVIGSQSLKYLQVMDTLRQPDWYAVADYPAYQQGFALYQRKSHYLPGISVVIHTRNEQEMLPACLASVSSWASEVIVVDMESEDQTCTIAKQAGARVLHHVPVDCVDEARNFALAQVNYHWTLVLDADEHIPDTLRELLLHVSKTAEAALTGLWLPRKNIFFGQWIRTLFPDYQLRFFRSGRVTWPGLVHEFPEIDGDTQSIAPDPECAILHYSYHTLDDFLTRQHTYAEIRAKQQRRLLSHKAVDAAQWRKRFDERLMRAQEHIKTQDFTPLEWSLHHLYMYGQLLTTVHMQQAAGALEPLAAVPPRLSVYTYMKNAVRFAYPFEAAILSLLEICDEMVIGYAVDSDDDTEQVLRRLAQAHPKIRLFPSEVWCDPTLRNGEAIRRAAEEAMGHCTGDWLLHLQADEVYHEQEVAAIRELINTHHHTAIAGFRFPVKHFYARYDQVIRPEAQAAGWYTSSLRLTRRGTAHQVGDAWTLALLPEHQGQELWAREVSIYHYGHVRPPAIMGEKQAFMERLYHDLPETEAVEKFSYNRVDPAHLSYFDGVHPRWIRTRIHAGLVKSKKPRLLILSRHHRLKKGFGITLNEIYQTGKLQADFEVHQLAWHYHGPDQIQDGVYIYGSPDEFGENRLEWLIALLEPAVILLHADMHFFLRYLPVLNTWKGPVVGWFTVDYERTNNPTSVFPLMERCDKIIALSDFGRQQLQQNYRGPLDIVSLGVNLNRFHAVSTSEKQALRSTLGWPQQTRIFLMVANNFWRKGIEYAVEAWRLFRAQNPELAAQSLLYLHTTETPALKELIRSARLEDSIWVSQGFDPMRSPIDDDALARYYQASDALILTTLGEGFGMPLLEAQACHLPIIASDNSVIREVVKKGGRYIRAPLPIPGITADCVVWMRPPDVNHAAQLIAELAQNPEVCYDLGQQGWKQAQMQTWHDTAEKLTISLLGSVGTGPLLFVYPEPELITL